MIAVRAILLVLALLVARDAGAVEYNFAGSVSLNYKTLVNELADPKVERSLILTGFNLNASVKAVVDVSPYLSGTVKLCYGCHGLEAANFFADITPHKAINIRAGRIMPAFGDFYLRHDPTSHKTPDNPLPYDMGHMVHGREWAYGVLPIPYVDNGAEVYGTIQIAEPVAVSYAAHVVSGLKAQENAPQAGQAVQPGQNPPTHDFSLRRSRFVTTPDYMVDNNRWPSVGGRLAFSFSRTGRMSALVPDLTIGGSAIYGPYDDYDQLSYLIYGVDFYLHVWRVNLRAEVLRRQQQVDARLLDFPDGRPVAGPSTIPTSPIATIYKDGFYVESDFPIGPYFEGVLRLDGMRRSGPREARKNPDSATYVAPPAALLDFDDWILRYTVGLNFMPVTGAKLKVAYELWTFKDVQDSFRSAAGQPPFGNEHMLHIALAASF